MCRATVLAAYLGWLLAAEAWAADIVLENARFQVVLDERAQCLALVDKITGQDHCAADARVPFATAVVDGQYRRADQASLAGDRLTLGFAGCDTLCVYQVATAADWITFQLESVTGTRPSRMTLAALAVTLTERVGPVLSAAWNDQSAVCLRGINLQTHSSATRRPKFAELAATAQDEPGPKLEGSGAALLVGPPDELRGMLSHLAAAYDLPRNEAGGVASRDLPLARQSYWFLNFAENETDKVIAYCRQAGLRQVMLGSASWCRQVGHYTFNTTAYPDGVDSLRRTVAKLHQAGILVGMHTFASKVSKTDAYVTPVPDRRFCVDMTATLAQDVGPDDTQIRTNTDLSQWPGSPVCRRKVWEGHVTKHQEVIVDDEIIYFESIGPPGKWDTFEGCRRGAWKTVAAAHQAGAIGRHYLVDGCINGYIIDLDSSLFEETSSRLAEIFNTCQFDMVYFDGSEDVDMRRYHYYAAKAHAVPMRKFSKRPLVHMGGGFANELWHSFTRGGTVDQYPGTYLAYLHAGGTLAKFPTCKEHIDRSVRSALRCADDMTPGELGWFGINPQQGDYDGLQYDEIEYLMCKSLALGAPISLQTGFAHMDAHPLTPDILEIVRAYEQLRLAGGSASTAALAELGKDFVLLRGSLLKDADTPEFVEVQGLPEVAGTHDLRAFVGAHGPDTIATLWHYLGKSGRLMLESQDVAVFDVRGEPVKVEQASGTVVVPIEQQRLTLRFPGLAPDAVRGLLAKARFEARRPRVLWIPASACRATEGAMLKGSQIGLRDPDAVGDMILSSGKIDPAAQADNYCEYSVSVPRKGRWTLWARVRYPGGGDLSFGVATPGEAVTLTGNQVLGNCGKNDARWHWTGRGGGSTTAPPGEPIILSLDAGEFVFRIYPREGGGNPATSPRLDAFCLAEDSGYRPNDADAKAGLAR